MFDAEYFQHHLGTQVQTIGQNPVVRVILESEHEYFVRGVDSVQPGYVMLNVYPSASAQTFLSESHYDVAQVQSYPVAVAYEAISQVFVSNSTIEDRARIGFFS